MHLADWSSGKLDKLSQSSMGNTLDKREDTDPRGKQSSESRETEQRGMLAQGTIKTLDYPCCRKLGTRHKAFDKVKNKNYNKEVIILHQAFCDHCSTIEGESELSRNKHRIIYQPYIILYTFTLVLWWEISQWNSTLHGRTHAHPTALGHHMQCPWNQTRMQLQTTIIIVE